MEKIFIDSDVILDLLAEREPFNIPAAKLISLGVENKIELYTSSLCFHNLNYLLSKQSSKAISRQILIDFRKLINILSVNDRIIDFALNSDFSDFEDAIQYHTALENQINAIVTRNLKDYKKATIPVMTAEMYLAG